MGFTLLLGGARSGKSDFAVDAAQRSGRPVSFIATASAGDDDMTKRIQRHQADRPPSWSLIEETVHLASALQATPAADVVIVDCLTVWTANLLLSSHDEEEIVAEAVKVAEVASQRSALTMVVSNEVGLGVHPATEVGRRYRDLLGRVNTSFGSKAATTLFFAAGLAVTLTDPAHLLDNLIQEPGEGSP